MPYIVSVGYFDGLHLGHKKLFESMSDMGKKLGLKTLVVTFDERPEDVLKNEKTRKLLFLDKEKEIKKFGIDEILTLSFREIQKMTATDFLDKLFQKKDVSHFFSTDKLRFGSDKKKANDLENYFKERSIEVVNVNLEEHGGEVISSSLIRKYLSLGEVSKIKALLGDFYFVEGEVVQGESKGRIIGFPTANVFVDESVMLPKNASYITLCLFDGLIYKSMSFLGLSHLKKEAKNGEGGHFFETHLIDFNGNLYGKKIQVQFLSFLRENKKFDSFEELKNALIKDKEKTMVFFKTMI